MNALQTAIGYWHRKHGVQASEALSTSQCMTKGNKPLAQATHFVTLRNTNGLLGRVRVDVCMPKDEQRNFYYRCTEV